jgi:hypothetical protein
MRTTLLAAAICIEVKQCNEEFEKEHRRVLLMRSA